MMANEAQRISAEDVVYIIGKYSFNRDEKPQVIEVQVSHALHKRLYAYPLRGHGIFSFNNSNLGKSVFRNRDDAERALEAFRENP